MLRHGSRAFLETGRAAVLLLLLGMAVSCSSGGGDGDKDDGKQNGEVARWNEFQWDGAAWE